MLKQLFRSLGGRIVLIVISSIVLTLATCLWVLHSKASSIIRDDVENEMKALLVQVESTTDSIGELAQSGAFNYAEMAKELEEKGKENYRNTTFYKTVPVVAAWAAVRKAIEGTPISFRIVREQPRNPDNAPKSSLDRQILDAVGKDGKSEVFLEDRESGVIAYARPVIMSKSCMSCHGNPANSRTGDGRDVLGFQMEGWKEGDRRGAYVLTVPTSYVDKPVREAMIAASAWAIPAGLIVLIGSVLIVLRINRQLSDTTNHLENSSEQLASASGQVSTASQRLAEGASEQAASLEVTSSSLEEIATVTKRNAENAQQAKESSHLARTAAEAGLSEMQSMMSAMSEINKSGDKIAKIIRTIDEIAFQTNILALNAAVEAARAGEAGLGFAVVADEVRNLARRSADAAKETAEIIEESIGKSRAGTEISRQVADGLNSIVTKAREVDDLIAQIALASEEQSQGVDLINSSINKLDSVTQSNAAGAEESASASEELLSQASVLHELVADLRSMITGQESSGQSSPTPSADKYFFESGTHPHSSKGASKGSRVASLNAGSRLPLSAPTNKGGFEDME